MHFHSNDLYKHYSYFWNSEGLMTYIERLKKMKMKIPPYIVIRERHIPNRDDVRYGQTYLLVYDTKDNEYNLYHSYDKNPFEFSPESLHGKYGGSAETLEEAISSMQELIEADYADSKRRRRSIKKPKTKRCRCK
jgi:hypothetical protein